MERQPNRHPERGPISVEENRIPEFIAEFLQGEDKAGDVICEILLPHLKRDVRRFLSSDDLDSDDVVQETLTVVLGFLQRNRGFEGNLIRFAVTVARNHCRTIYHRRRRWPQSSSESLENWVADPARSPLDLLEASERQAILQRALEKMGRDCRRLIRAFYFQEKRMTEIQRILGLGTVQSVYYRRKICLKKLFIGFKNHFGSRSLEAEDTF